MDMSIRPVYLPKLKKPFYEAVNTEFEWTPGISPGQRKKNSAALRETFLKEHPDMSVLEVSTKSDNPKGEALSPFNLMKSVPSLKKAFPVENIYQASKVFSHGGPYYDLLGVSPLEAKRDGRLKNSGDLVHYRLENTEYPAAPDILFYNWLYIRALHENKALAQELLHHDAFTDIEFNPALGNKNNQARACAIYASLARLGLLSQTESFEDFKKLFLEQDITEIVEQKSIAKEEPTLDSMRKAPARRRTFSVGQWLEHPGIGKGEVIRKNRDSYLINFKISGPRTIAKDFVEKQCRPL